MNGCQNVAEPSQWKEQGASVASVGMPLASHARGIALGMIPKPVQSAGAYSRTRNQGASAAPQVIT